MPSGGTTQVLVEGALRKLLGASAGRFSNLRTRASESGALGSTEFGAEFGTKTSLPNSGALPLLSRGDGPHRGAKSLTLFDFIASSPDCELVSLGVPAGEQTSILLTMLKKRRRPELFLWCKPES